MRGSKVTVILYTNYYRTLCESSTTISYTVVNATIQNEKGKNFLPFIAKLMSNYSTKSKSSKGKASEIYYII